MTYTPYLIADFATGLDRRLQPWLSPDDAQQEFYDGYVYRGTMSKREGYVYFATGERAGGVYRESRIIHTLTAVPALQVPNGAITTFTLAGTGPIARGSVAVNGSNPVVVGTDDGLGSITGAGITAGTVDYLTGALSVTFTVAPVGASTVTFTYSFMPGNPVMMVANFVTDSVDATTGASIKELVVADTQYVNRYDPLTDVLVDVVIPAPYTGNRFNFFTWVNYPTAANAARLLFCNNKDIIQSYDGSTVTAYAPTYPAGVTSLKCALMFQMKDRLILLRTTEDTTVFGRRIRISGTGTSCDDFSTAATGAGFIDIPDATWISGAAFNRDDLIIFTEQATWILKYTGNDTTPFVLDKIDESRGSEATYAAITYLNRTSALSRRGLIISDGYRVERQDTVIPDFSYNEIDGAVFGLCFAGSVDADRDHYLIYPNEGQTAGVEISRRILTTNYDEDNYSIYRLPLSCMGNYVTAFDIDWNDLVPPRYSNWDQFAAVYGSWDAFAYNAGAPFSIGGGHHGEIWSLAVKESEDNPVHIYNITVIDATTIEVTTDWNNYVEDYKDKDNTLSADFIFLTGIEGMIEVNDQQFPISQVVSNNVFKLNVGASVIPATSFTAYTGGGKAMRVIPFYSLMKQFNPFIEMGKKVRCGWIYMYVDSTGTSLKRLVPITGITQSNPCVVTTSIDNGFKNGEQISFSGIGGMVELNDQAAFITVIDDTTFSLNGINSTAFTPYTSGGYAAAAERAKITIQILTNDRTPNDFTQLNNLSQDPYQGTATNLVFEDGAKKWYKVYINQVGNFIQFLLTNTQAGATINIQATMPGFSPTGRIV